MKRLTILGSTGSVGKNTLDLVALHPEQFEVFALTAKSRYEVLFSQCLQFNPHYAVLENDADAEILRKKILHTHLRTEVLSGARALQDVAAAIEVDYVMAAIVGGAGLLPTLAAAKAGKRILLANKEALVMSGQLFMDAVRDCNATLLPVDSEHSALFQCMPTGYLPGNIPTGVNTIILTASGGPFRTLPLAQFGQVTPRQAVSHPNWSMGNKISIDSATMMNKGLEVIEAYWLFNIEIKQIEVVVHPQSIIHSIVDYCDGSMLAQLGSPDMRTPIAYALSWPGRIRTKVKRLNLIETSQLTFESVDNERFPCLNIAYQALKAGGSASTLINAANEIAVAKFLEGCIRFNDIPCVIAEVLDQIPCEKIASIEDILEVDRKAREVALQYVVDESVL